MSNDDVRRWYDPKELITALDLEGRDAVLTIKAVEPGEVTGDGGKKSKKPVITFVGKTKKMIVNRTNLKIIGGLYGYAASGWAGKQITIYPTTTKFGPDQVDAIRVRPAIPKEQSK